MVRIESGRTPPLRSPTFRKLDHVLEWPPGSAQSVYAGGEPLEADDQGPAVAAGHLQVAVGSLTALVEAANLIASAATQYEPTGGPLTSALNELRSALSPLVGRVVSAMLSAPSPEGIPAARVAQAIEAFMSRPPDDETPARTSANAERRELFSKVVSQSPSPTEGNGDDENDADDS